MNIVRKTNIAVAMSQGELMDALKRAFPHELSIQAMPSRPTMREGHLTMEASTAGISIVYVKQTDLPPMVSEHQ